ncbi:hypothetical protein SFC23_18785 [Shouchella clausii]
MVLNVLFILIGVIYLAASYFIGIKKNLNFISFLYALHYFLFLLGAFLLF